MTSVNNFTPLQSKLHSLWSKLECAGNSCIPLKSSVKDQDIQPLISELGMAEWLGDNDLRIGHFGKNADANFYDEIEHHNAFDFTHPSAYFMINNFWKSYFNQPCGLIMKTLTRLEQGNAWEFIGLHFPLANEDGTCSSVISVFEKGETFTDLPPSPEGLMEMSDFLSFQYIDIGNGVPTMPDGLNDNTQNSSISLI